jgi:hypothetical protein
LSAFPTPKKGTLFHGQRYSKPTNASTLLIEKCSTYTTSFGLLIASSIRVNNHWSKGFAEIILGFPVSKLCIIMVKASFNSRCNFGERTYAICVLRQLFENQRPQTSM